MDVNPETVKTAFRVTGTTLMIHGHTHRPGIHEIDVDGRPCTRVVLGDWYTQGSVLRVQEDGRFELDSLPRD
jgi:UDP-2,3-diacylglucosamine hydrolase